MKDKNPVPGRIAISLQGRDRGTLYIVCGTEGERLLLSDGTRHPKENPKRKNLKHVRLLNRTCAEYGIAYPWDKSFNVNAAYALKQIGAEATSSPQSEE